MLIGVPITGWVAITAAVLGFVVWLVRLEGKAKETAKAQEKQEKIIVPRSELNIIVTDIKDDIKEIKIQNEKQFSAINNLGLEQGKVTSKIDTLIGVIQKNGGH